MKKGLFYTTIFYLLLFWVIAFAHGNQKLGDIHSGSMAGAVHNINLVSEEGDEVSPGDELLMPFSTRQTCGVCHDYKKISGGWHFNAVDADVASGRAGQPWLFVDAATGTQIPVSYRDWPGTFRPEEVGLTSWQFTRLFARQMPGGGAGEVESANPEEVVRSFVSGKLEINCLSCHNAHPGQDQAEWANQIRRENFRWAAAGACEFASVSGSAKEMPDSYDPLMPGMYENQRARPTIVYRDVAFDHKSRVLFDIVKQVPSRRCYFCHSTAQKNEDSDEDVHLSSGLSCIDCHHNGLDHNIVRGYEGEKNALAAGSSCRGCHLGSDEVKAGRLGAPVPKHAGIPAVHFEKISCTGCHSGPWPEMESSRVKTSQSHGLGTHGVNVSADVPPYITSGVFAKGDDGKIVPVNMVWPAFWANLVEGKVKPVSYDIVKKVNIDSRGGWPNLTDEQIAKVLKLLSSEGAVEGKAVYVCGGKIHRLNEDGKLISEEHEAAKPYVWAVGHNVRPAAQSLGSGGCDDCHSKDAGFLFGKVAVDSPLVLDKGAVRDMVEFEGLASTYTKWFAWSFVFRPMLKIVALGSCAVIGLVLLLYGLKALAYLVRVLAGEV